MKPLSAGIGKLVEERKRETGNFLPDPDYQRVIDGQCGEDDPVISNIELMHEGFEIVQTKDIKVQFGLVEGEKLHYCPYDRSHQILDSKWAQHLEKCRHNYLKNLWKGKAVVKVDVCPYAPNLHHLSEFYMLRHVFICPDREAYDSKMDAFQKLEAGLLCTENPIKKMNDDVKAIHSKPPKSTSSSSSDSSPDDGDDAMEEFDDWDDDDGTAGGYNPQEKLSRGFYYETPQGLTKSERDDFIRQNSERVEALGGIKKIRSREESELLEDSGNANRSTVGKFALVDAAGEDMIKNIVDCNENKKQFDLNHGIDPYEKYLAPDVDCSDTGSTVSDDAGTGSPRHKTEDDSSGSDSDSTIKADTDDEGSYCYDTEATFKTRDDSSSCTSSSTYSPRYRKYRF